MVENTLLWVGATLAMFGLSLIACAIIMAFIDLNEEILKLLSRGTVFLIGGSLLIAIWATMFHFMI